MATPDMEPKRLSCISCRQRKIKCNRLDPCNHCTKAGQKCVFPKPVRVRGGSKVRNAEITKRISRLEGLLRKLNGDGTAADGAAAEAATGASTELADVSEDEEMDGDDGDATPDATANEVREHEPVHKSDGTTYLGGELWATLSGEVDGLRQLLDQSSDDEEEQKSGSSRSRASEQPQSLSPFFLHNMSPPLDLRQLHPHPPLITTTYCDVYFSRVDPCFKLLHQPTVRRVLAGAAGDLRKLADDRPVEALMFAFYFITITSLRPDECSRLFCNDKQSLLERYQQGTEAALANADFLNSNDLTTLQAFIIYVLCMRTTTTSRAAWALSSLTARLGQALGIHRDEDNDAVPPFEAQMRRRAWWAVVMMDSCFCEDRGTPRSFLTPYSYPRQAANVNDADIWPGMLAAPTPREGWTEMSFCLLCHEAAIAASIATSKQGDAALAGDPSSQRSLEDVVCDSRDRMESRYLRDLDERKPLQWVAARVSRCIVVRRWLSIYYPLHTRRVIRRSAATKHELLAAAISALEIGDEMEHAEVARPFQWFLQLWSQWYSLSVALAELCTQTRGPQVDRAWALLDSGFVDLWAARIADGSGGQLWKPIQKLWDKARETRHAAAAGHPRPSITPRAVAAAAAAPLGATPAARNAATAYAYQRAPWDLTTPSTGSGSPASPETADGRWAAGTGAGGAAGTGGGDSSGDGPRSQVALGNSVVSFPGRGLVDNTTDQLRAPSGAGRGLPWLFDGGPAGGMAPAGGGGGGQVGGKGDAALLGMDVDVDGELELEGWGDWEQFLTGTFQDTTV